MRDDDHADMYGAVPTDSNSYDEAFNQESIGPVEDKNLISTIFVVSKNINNKNSS